LDAYVREECAVHTFRFAASIVGQTPHCVQAVGYALNLGKMLGTYRRHLFYLRVTLSKGFPFRVNSCENKPKAGTNGLWIKHVAD
jgi:hypothetical protein